MEYSLDPYDPMAGQDWSGIMPQGVFAGSDVRPTDAMMGLVSGGGEQYQPWSMSEDSVMAAPIIGAGGVQYNPLASPTPSPNAPPGAPPGSPSPNAPPSVNLQTWEEPGWDYSGRYGGTKGKAHWMPNGWSNSLDWTNGQLTFNQQVEGWGDLLGLVDNAGTEVSNTGLINVGSPQWKLDY